MPLSKYAYAERHHRTLTRRMMDWQQVELPKAEARLERAIEWRTLRLNRAKAQLEHARAFLKTEMEAANHRVKKATEWRNEVLARIEELESQVEDATADLKEAEMSREAHE